MGESLLSFHYLQLPLYTAAGFSCPPANALPVSDRLTCLSQCTRNDHCRQGQLCCFNGCTMVCVVAGDVAESPALTSSSGTGSSASSFGAANHEAPTLTWNAPLMASGADAGWKESNEGGGEGGGGGGGVGGSGGGGGGGDVSWITVWGNDPDASPDAITASNEGLLCYSIFLASTFQFYDFSISAICFGQSESFLLQGNDSQPTRSFNG